MDTTDKANLDKLLAELRTIQDRLTRISNAALDDMEGADMPSFKIAEELWCGLEKAAVEIADCIANCETLSTK